MAQEKNRQLIRQQWDRIWKIANERGYEYYQDFARDIGVTPSTLTHISKGRNGISTKLLQRMAKTLGVSRNYLELDMMSGEGGSMATISIEIEVPISDVPQLLETILRRCPESTIR